MIRRFRKPIQIRVNGIRTISKSSTFDTFDISDAPLGANELHVGCRLGIDSHADTTCLNKHAHIECTHHGMTVDTVPFSGELGTLKSLPIIDGILAFDHPTTMETILLRARNSIYIKDMENCLLCPNQARASGVIVDDVPQHLDHSGMSTHSISNDGVNLPLKMYGPTSFLPVRRPTSQELEECNIFDLTDDTPWEPYGPSSIELASITSDHVPNAHVSQISHPLDSILECQMVHQIAAIHITKPKESLTPAYLSAIWGCGLDTAARTIKSTTQHHYRQTSGQLTRRFKTRRSQLQYRQLGLPAGQFYSDTFFANVKSVRGYVCAQVYGNKYGFVKAYNMMSKSGKDIGESLTMLVQDVGVPAKLHTDNAPEMTGLKTEFVKRARREQIQLSSTEPHTPNENRGEILVRDVKMGTKRLMARKNVPLRLWCFATEYVAELRSFMAHNTPRTKGRSGYEILFGFTPDISEYVEFEFYDYCYYHEPSANFPHGKRNIGRWLGVAHKVGQGMNYYIMTMSGRIQVRSTVSPVPADDSDVLSVKQQMQDLDNSIHSKIGDYRNAIIDKKSPIPDVDITPDSQYDFGLGLTPTEIDLHSEAAFHDSDRPELDDSLEGPDRTEFDKFIGLNVTLPSLDGESVVLGKIRDHKRGHDGFPIGRMHNNPILSTAIYQVETPDGNLEEYTANVIAENLYSQVDDNGQSYGSLSEIIGHRKTASAITIEDGTIDTSSGQRKRITTKGWDLQVRWNDHGISWIALKDIKESNPIMVAEYAIAKKLDKEPAFAWWVKQALRRRDSIISKVRTRCSKRNIKFGIIVPRTAEEAFALDRENGNDFWAKAIQKEMNNIQVAFKFLDPGERAPPGYRKITCHLIFDVKFDLTRKARYVAGGHMTKVPAAMTFASVVSRDSVRIMFLIAALNDLDIKMCDVGNAYLNADTREKVFFVAGSEWRHRQGQNVLIVRACYGLKSSGAEWKKTFADCIRFELGFDPCYGADDNVYIKAEKNPEGDEYYSYIIVYVDDVLCISKTPTFYLNKIKGQYRLKQDPETPTMYLGADISRFEIQDESGESYTTWAMSADSHIKKALEVVETRLQLDHLQFRHSKKTATQPFTSPLYRPETDTSEECDNKQAEFYQSLIGILRWLCELGRIDILAETAMLSSFLAAPRIGHLHQACHVFKYLKDHNRSKLVFDQGLPEINDNHLEPTDRAEFKAKFMKELYPDAIEEIPQNAPKPKGKSVRITMFVDADHAGDKVTRRSRTGILLFLNKAPMIWHSKKQNTVEASSFGSEFVAMRAGIDMLKAFKYKLRMFGIPIEDGQTKVFGDNNSVIINASNPESNLKRKHHSINYHSVREAVAAGVALIFKVDTGENLADLFTKVLDQVKRKQMVQKILW